MKNRTGIFKILTMLTLTAVFSGCRTDAPPLIVEKETEEIQQTVITYKVEPEDFIRDSSGYTGIEYLTREEAVKKIRLRLEKNKASLSDYEKACSKVPEFGNIILHIGRQELMHANTRWYIYTVKKGDEYIINRRGEEGIPNIKGRDGNWWNLISLPVNEEITDKLAVYIKDNKTGKIYSFVVRRFETLQ